MPNFVAKSLNEPDYPAKIDGVEFLWSASGDGDKLILTSINNHQFFLILKQNTDGDFVVKSDKISRPADLNSVANALKAFEKISKAKIKSAAYAIKPQKPKDSGKIIDEYELLNRIKGVKSGTKILLEIGFGSARHLIYQAKNNKNALIIGIETYKPACEQANRLASNLDNIFILNSDARLVLSLLPASSVSRIFLHFPVPWPDAPARRVVSEIFASEIEAVLADDGVFELRTDDKDYKDYALNIFKTAGWDIKSQTNEPAAITSKYEARWQKLNKNIFDLFFSKTERNNNGQKQASGDGDFSFDKNADIFKISGKTIKKDDHFIHAQKAFKISDDKHLLRVSLGAFDRPQTMYITSFGGDIKYLLKHPLPTAQNLKAHQTLSAILSGDGDSK